MKNYEQLEVRQKAHALIVRLYEATATVPRPEMFGLTSQIRRAAASIGANLAEGCGRWNEVELARYVQMAMGSASELQNHLKLAQDPGFLPASADSPLVKAVISVRQMLTAQLQTLRRTRKTAPPAPANGQRRVAMSGVTS